MVSKKKLKGLKSLFFRREQYLNGISGSQDGILVMFEFSSALMVRYFFLYGVKLYVYVALAIGPDFV